MKPTEWTQYCGDAGYWLTQLRWTSWNDRAAAARGVGVPTKGCGTTCGRKYPLEVRLDRPRLIPGFEGRALFTQIHITYPAKGPHGQSSDAGSLRDVWESALSSR